MPAMNVDIYCDPACPWCWVTSRWLVEVQRQRPELTITWKPFSLWRKNRETFKPEYLEAVWVTHRWLRVMQAVAAAEGNDAAGRLYEVLGTARHHDDVREVDLVEALTAAGCDPALATAADDESWDDDIGAAMDHALALSGDDVGTPLIAFDDTAAFFGPVVAPTPRGEQALELFDAVRTLATMPGFWELKRSRDGGPEMPERPDVAQLHALQPAT